MKVLHLLKTSVGATWALRQMRELVKNGVEVHAAMPSGGPLVEQCLLAGIKVHCQQADLPVRSPWLCKRTLNSFRQLVAAVNPDIIHSHFVGTTLTMRLALGKHHNIPRIFQVPGPLHLEHRFFRQAELLTAGPIDYWIGSCRWTCERYQRSGISEDRLFLSYYGVDLDDFEQKPGGKLRCELQLQESDKLVGLVAFMYAPKKFLGQQRGLKGHEDLIDALAICREQDPSIKGVIIGGAWNNAIAYEKQVRLYGQKRCGDSLYFLGTRHDVPDLYPDLDVAVHPSHSENVGGALESLLSCVPTIATNIGGFPDLVRPGQTGWLVPPRQPRVLAEAIMEALACPEEAKRRAENGRKLAKELFDVKQNAMQVLQAYQEILGNRCKRSQNEVVGG